MGFENINWNDVQEAEGFERLPAGGYVVKIMAAEDVPEREYIKISFDIAEGKYANYFTKQYRDRMDSFGKANWGGTFIRSYREKAQPFMKAFITAVERSNPGFTFGGKLTEFKGKLLGIVMRDEEYLANNGDYRWIARFDSAHDAEKIRSGEYKAPEPKPIQRLSDIGKGAPVFTPADDDGILPF